MALSITSVGAHDSGTATNSTPAFIPPAGSVIILGYFGFLFAIGTATIADTFGDTGGTTWTPFTGALLTSAGTFGQTYGGWYRTIGTGASSGTITVSVSGFTGGETIICADQITSSSGSVSVPQSNCHTANFSATGSASLASTPANTSLVWSGAGSGHTGQIPIVTTAGFTQLDLVNSGTSLSQATAYQNTFGPITVAWSGLNAGQSNSVYVAEIAETTSGFNGGGTVVGTFTATATGAVTGFSASGAANATFTATATATFSFPASGTVVGTFTGNANGVPTVFGNGTVVGTFTATANALIPLSGQGTIVGTFTANATGINVGITTGLATFTFTATALAVPTLFASGAATFGFSATARIPTAGAIIYPETVYNPSNKTMEIRNSDAFTPSIT